MTELLNCPFCGKPPSMDEHPPTPGEDDSFVVVRCSSCGISKEYNFPTKAIQWWNTRTPPGLSREAIARIVFDHLPGNITWEDHTASHVVPFAIADAILSLKEKE